MDFRTAVDILAHRITTEEIAERAGVSMYAIRQARLHRESEAWRPPPPGWRGVLASIAEERAGELVELARELRAEDSPD